ncbi:MipA/OmpV family protein [Kangiella sp. TOML190]|uniref:MipA/OmpV family protein n=1 Tax=Kangiella sp. TOML190 TaxID=2931351 RepID=UPI00203E3B57|nr:MipA/OmpV family protein [Kangiella sp. TOML190]
MKTKYLFSAFVLLNLVLFSSLAKGDQNKTGWLWGIGALADYHIYDDVGTRTFIGPYIGYKGEKFSFIGPEFRYKFYEKDGFRIAGQLSLLAWGHGYEEDDSSLFEGMEDRDFSFGPGIVLGYKTGPWDFEFNSAFDALNNSEGMELMAKASYKFHLGSFSLKPMVALDYFDEDYMDYYYGVKASEATLARPQFSADSSLNKVLGITLTTNEFFGGVTSLSVQNIWYDSDIEDSPLVDDDSNVRVLLSFTRFF